MPLFNAPKNELSVARQSGMVRGFANLLRAAARPKIYSMHTEAALERGLRKALNVSGTGRAFEPMQKNDLPEPRALGLMLDDGNHRRIIDPIPLAHWRESLLTDLPRPKIARDRQKVGITNEWSEVGQV